jgi:phenylpropionate dioxygenase-like ring-hydroxylating dioxygenase large terminal subunit
MNQPGPVHADASVSASAPASGLGWSEADLAAVGAAHWRDLYTSPAVDVLERDAVFRTGWNLACSVDEVPEGTYVAVEVAGVPIAVWHGSDGRLRAFHNICPHRGILLVQGRGPIGRFVTCPYHQWSFDTDGALARIPQPEQFPHAEAAALALHPVPLVEWHGLVFVCPSEPAPDFDAEVALLEERLAGHLAAPVVQVARADYTVACNWKLLVENHVDVYHLWYLHQRSLSPYRHPSFEWRWEDPTWWSLEPLKDPAEAPGDSEALGGLGGLSEEERTGIGAHLLFPNLMLVTTGDYFATYDAKPDGPGSCRLTLRVRSHPDADGEALVESIRSFLAEDVVACEAVQTATASPWYGVGPTALRHEEPVRRFHALLRRRLLGPDAVAG